MDSTFKGNTRHRMLVTTSVCLLLWVLSTSLSSAQVVLPPDPGSSGSFAQTEYNFGDGAFISPDFPYPVEDRARVFYPADLSNGAPFPVIIFLHGKHPVCHNGTRTEPPDESGTTQWPCPSDYPYPIWNYQGYDYVGSNLASHGYVVVSISANGINAVDEAVLDPMTSRLDYGIRWRAELIQHHLDYLNTCNSGPCPQLGSLFTGKLNLQRVGTMGHSRGGEGVIRHFIYNRDEPNLPHRYGITAVLPLAPTNFHRYSIGDAALGVLLPYCDGDALSLPGVHYFDDNRYNLSPKPRHTFLVMGANHNFYNTVWSPSSGVPGGRDDWDAYSAFYENYRDPYCGATVIGNGRLSEERQRGTGIAYINAFMRTYASSSSELAQYQFIPYLTGDTAPPPSAQGATIYASYHAATGTNTRLDLNRLLTPSDLTTNTLGGLVTQSGLYPYSLCGGESPQPENCLPRPPYQGVHEPHTILAGIPPDQFGLSQLNAGWTSTLASYRNDLPQGQGDISRFETLQFRVSVKRSSKNKGLMI